MDLNDRIEEADDVTELEALVEEVKQIRQNTVNELEIRFEAISFDNKNNCEDLKKLGELLNNLKYIQSSESYLNNKLHSIRQKVSIQTDYASYNKRV